MNIINLEEGKSWVETMDLPNELQLDDEGFKKIWSLKPEIKETFKIFGKEVEVPRYHIYFGQSYRFSNTNHVAAPLTNEFLLQLNAFVNKHSRKEYNQCMLNFYEDGKSYIGYHADAEKQLVNNSSIYSFSFGAERRFLVQSIKDKTKKYELPLKNNTCIIMGGEIQTYYKHSVPKQLRVKEPRINVTFRLFSN